MASPRVSAPRWDSDGVLIGGARWPVSGVRLQRYGSSSTRWCAGRRTSARRARLGRGRRALLASLGASGGRCGTYGTRGHRARRVVAVRRVRHRVLSRGEAGAGGSLPSRWRRSRWAFPPRAEEARSRRWWGSPHPRPRRASPSLPFDLTEPDRSDVRRAPPAEGGGGVRGGALAAKEFADPKRIEDLHAAAEKKAVALEAERARLERDMSTRDTNVPRLKKSPKTSRLRKPLTRPPRPRAAR